MLVNLNWPFVFLCESLHFLLGFSVGLLTFSSMLTIYLIIFSTSGRLPTLTHSALARDVFYILLCSLSLSVVSHVLEDYFFAIF